MYISIDPGQNVGLATFREDGTDIKRSALSLPVFRKSFLKLVLATALESTEGKLHFITEDYKLRQDMAIAQTGSDMPASRCIGAVEMVCDIIPDQATLTLVKPGDLRGALKWAGFPELAKKPRSWHCPDDMAAYAHGVKYLIDKGIRKHPIFN